MNPATLAAVATAASTAGILLIVTGLVGTRRPAASTSQVAAFFGVGLSTSRRRARRSVLALAAAATATGWLLTGWPVGGLIAGLAVVGLPWLLTVGRDEQRMIARLEAVETWTRRLKELVKSGHGLISGIVTSARTAPAPIAAEVNDLAADLQAGADPPYALHRFADQLADFTADEVIAALQLHANDRGQRLTDVLTSLARSAAAEVVVRRGVAAKRAEPRFVTRFMTALIAIVLMVVFANHVYAKPYAELLGQLVLFAATLVLVGLLAWIRRLTQPQRHRRFLAPADAPTHGAAPSTPIAAQVGVR